jgi:sodium pump decarboxylase gamma subunit
MIAAGLKLMLLGMAVVFGFLTLILYSIKASYALLVEKTEAEFAALRREQQEARERRKKAGASKSLAKDDTPVVAVISAALAMHRSRTGA